MTSMMMTSIFMLLMISVTCDLVSARSTLETSVEEFEQLMDEKATVDENCGFAPEREAPLKRVVGGVEASLKHQPWLVQLSMNMCSGRFGGRCGGSIISDQWILTAAHCVLCDDRDLFAVRDFEVIVGMEYAFNYANTTHTEKYAPHNVIDAVVHPKYDKTMVGSKYDIALLKLETPLDLEELNISQLCLPDREDSFYGKTCIVSGWGKKIREAGGRKFLVKSDKVREVHLEIAEWEKCKKHLAGEKNRIYGDCNGTDSCDNLLCAGDYENGGVDSCKGDSGGPLICKMKKSGGWVQAGIVSHGVPCAHKNTYTKYTSVAHFRDWIDEVKSGCFDRDPEVCAEFLEDPNKCDPKWDKVYRNIFGYVPANRPFCYKTCNSYWPWCFLM